MSRHYGIADYLPSGEIKINDILDAKDSHFVGKKV